LFYGQFFTVQRNLLGSMDSCEKKRAKILISEVDWLARECVYFNNPFIKDRSV